MKITMNQNVFKKWDVIKLYGNGEQIVVRVTTKADGYGSSTTLTTIPHKKFKSKIRHYIWFKILQLRVWIGDFYKE